jgi:hypothetical protein
MLDGGGFDVAIAAVGSSDTLQKAFTLAGSHEETNHVR